MSDNRKPCRPPVPITTDLVGQPQRSDTETIEESMRVVDENRGGHAERWWRRMIEG